MNRINIIDYIKAIGMLLVIWGHIIYKEIDHNVIYAFHMPLFFFLSGFVFSISRYPSFGAFVKRKFIGLLVPYAIFSFATWCIWLSYVIYTSQNVDSYIAPLIQTFIAQGSGGYLVHNVPLWFIPALFVVNIMYYGIEKIFSIAKCTQTLRALKLILISAICITISHIMICSSEYFDFSSLPWSIDVAFSAIPFFALGNYIARHIHISTFNSFHIKRKTIAVLLGALALIGLVIGSLYNGPVGMSSNTMNNIFIFYPSAICGIYVTFLIGLYLEQNLKSDRIKNSLLWFGRNSFHAMAIHNPIKGIVIAIIASLFGISTVHAQCHYGMALCAFFICLISTVFTMLLIQYFQCKFCKKA